MILLMLAQAAGTPPPAAPASEALAPIDFDLRTVKPATDEIVVTARRQDDQRMPPLTAYVAEEALPRAETGLFGNVRGAITAEQHALPGGVISNRAMVKLKVPF